MVRPSLPRRTLSLLALGLLLSALLAYTALRSGPLAPVAVTAVRVETRAIEPALFGIGTVASRYHYQIGSPTPGRVLRLDADVGDKVRAGQLLGLIDPVDLYERLRAQQDAASRAAAAVREAAARQTFSREQARRYARLLEAHAVSAEEASAKQQQAKVDDAALDAAREDLNRAKADLAALVAQHASLRLAAPADGLVSARNVDPGAPVVSGQTVLEVIDPKHLWVEARFDQAGGAGLARGLPARIVLRSRKDQILNGRVERVEPQADSVTEEMMAKIVFDEPPRELPPVGELAEVTVALPATAAAPVVPNAALQRQGEQTGVWLLEDDHIRFAPVKPGRADLNGHVQVLSGLRNGERVVVYSEKALSARSRVHEVASLTGAAQ